MYVYNVQRQEDPQPQSKFEAGLNCLIPCLKKPNQTDKTKLTLKLPLTHSNANLVCFCYLHLLTFYFLI